MLIIKAISISTRCHFLWSLYCVVFVQLHERWLKVRVIRALGINLLNTMLESTPVSRKLLFDLKHNNKSKPEYVQLKMNISDIYVKKPEKQKSAKCSERKAIVRQVHRQSWGNVLLWKRAVFLLFFLQVSTPKCAIKTVL